MCCPSGVGTTHSSRRPAILLLQPAAFAGAEPSGGTPRRRRGLSLAASNVARVDIEPAMPGLTEVAPYLHISTYQSWQEVGRWYWNLVLDQLQSDSTINSAAQVTAGCTATRTRCGVAPVRDRETRYVGWSSASTGTSPIRSVRCCCVGLAIAKTRPCCSWRCCANRASSPSWSCCDRAGLACGQPAGFAGHLRPRHHLCPAA